MMLEWMRSSLVCLVLCILVLVAVGCKAPYDLKISGAMVVDGTGAAAFRADVVLRGDAIAAIGPKITRRAQQHIAADGLVLTPGFIDLHAHIEPITLYPEMHNFLLQGVTTALGGPDGGSPWPIGSYIDSLATIGIAINVGYLLGHNTIRHHIMGGVDRRPTVDELEAMKAMVARAMQEGAFGISTGLRYLPGIFSEFSELVTLASVAGQQQGIYTSHLRNEGPGLLEAVAEAIAIAQEANLPVVLTHHKAMGEAMCGSSATTLSMVDAAVAAGIDVWLDQYPYTASQTSLAVLIPPWALQGHPVQDFALRCQDSLLHDSILRGIEEILVYERVGHDMRLIQFAQIDSRPEFVGRTMHDLLLYLGRPQTAREAAIQVIEIQKLRGAQCIYHMMDSVDVATILKHPRTMVASDGSITRWQFGHPHPRSYGTFPRVLSHYTREVGLLTLEEAVRKMTAMPANLLSLADRGRIVLGAKADLVLLDPDQIRDLATYQDPHQYPAGIRYVIVNGQVAVDRGQLTGIRAGVPLRFNKRAASGNLLP